MSAKNIPWGSFAPPKKAIFLQFLIKIGISRGIISRIIRKMWVKNFPTTVDVVVRGVRFRLDIKRNATDAKILTCSKYYDKEEIIALKAASNAPDSVFIDVGANTGYYSLMLYNAGFGKILAIEPNPPTLELLKFNININKAEGKVIVVPFCVGAKGRIPFYCDGGLGGASTLRKKSQTPFVYVESLPLVDILRNQKISRIDAMKIDIEGIEDKALFPFFESAEKSLWPKVVVIEDCNMNAWSNNIIKHMIDLGYYELSNTRGNKVLKLA